MNKRKLFYCICGCLLMVSCGTKSGNSSSENVANDSTPVQTIVDEAALDLQLLQGNWVNDEDSLATVTIKNNQWTFNYVDMALTEDNVYQISFADYLPKGVLNVENSVKAKYLILSNKVDSMYYEVQGLTNKELSLNYCIRGNTHLYTKK